MKKFLLIMISLLLAASLCACGGNEEEPDVSSKPPAFSVIQKQLKLTKHSEKSENTIFSKDDFANLLGEELSYITVTSLPQAEAGTLVFNGQSVAKGQNLPASQLEYLKFVPSGDIPMASFGFTCDSKSYAGNEMVCEMVFTDSPNSPPVAKDSKIQAVENISCFAKLNISEPNGDPFNVKVITYPANGYLKLSDNGEIVYTPVKDFHGNDKMVFAVTDAYGNESQTATLSINVQENQSGIYFADMENKEEHLYAHKMCESDVMIYRYENGQYYFDPEKQVSKMEFLVMLMNVAQLDTGITAVADSMVKDDTGLSSGLKGYLTAASEQGLLKLDDGMFSPKEGITFEDAAFMVLNALKLPSAGSLSAGASDDQNALSAVVGSGIIALDKEINGETIVTKAHAAKLLWGIESYMIENNMKTNTTNFEKD